ncbi:MAG TPA: hypothetical protein DIS77_09585 [Rothia sp.]|nr:hypothetical protein [Rothia sp. (in: high G+C Gram-positive bacteria)]
MPNQPTTGLTSEQSPTLITALNNHLTWVKPDQKPHQLTLPQALKMTLIYHRHNITEELLARIFSVSQPRVCRTTTTIEKTLARALKSLMKPLESGLKASGSFSHR